MEVLQIIEAYVIIIGSIIAGIVAICKYFDKPVAFVRKHNDKKRQKELDQVVVKMKEVFGPQFEDLQKSNKEQNEKIDALVTGTRDLLRARITEIYDKYKPYKKITERDREVLDLLFIDYKNEHGNGTVERQYNRTKEWEVVSDDTIF